MKKSSFFVLYFFLAAILMGVIFYFTNISHFSVNKKTVENTVTNSQPTSFKTADNVAAPAKLAGNQNNQSDKSNQSSKIDSVSSDLPAKIKINVPFTSQAPLGVWDQYHEEACEETTLVMLEYYLNQKPLSPPTAEREIQKMIAYEIKNDGDYKDTDAQQTVNLFNAFYGPPNDGKQLKVIYDFQEQDLKTYLAKGEPIIVPAAGQELGNPNFTPPGPLYHNLVLIGYDGNDIITNDPGTKHGAGYVYNIHTLYDAIHDFPGQPENIDQGRKAMIVLE